jgi:hypothetical protein
MNRITGTLALLILAAPASGAGQKLYSSAEQAAQALFLAVQSGDEQAVSQILGGDKELFTMDDKNQDDLDRQQFLEKYREMHRLVREPGGTVLYVGAENWPFPLPLNSKNGAWSFDARAGKREVLYRRIGANESIAIDLCSALARQDDRDAAALLGNPIPLHGYYFRARAPYFIAYPADYRSSGVMTFIVGRDGVVYERDLGPRTAKVATEMKPDSSWHALPTADAHGEQ